MLNHYTNGCKGGKVEVTAYIQFDMILMCDKNFEGGVKCLP